MAYYHINRWRTVAAGIMAASPDLSPGTLKVAPVGIGFLLTCGYVDDASVFYCPSSTNMPTDYRYGSGNFGAARELSDWKAMGGLDGHTMQYGDYRGDGEGPFSARSDRRGPKVESHYAYRNVPLWTWSGWHRWQDDPTTWDTLPASGRGAKRVPRTKPFAPIAHGEPMFKTVRALAGRAIVVDAFGKGTTLDGLRRRWADFGIATIEDTQRVAGFGIAGHRDVYNVLYGDGHSAIYGDPQQRLIWHKQGYYSGGTFRPYGGSAYYNNLSVNWYYSTLRWYCDYNAAAHVDDITPLSIWHELDVASGIDTDAF